MVVDLKAVRQMARDEMKREDHLSEMDRSIIGTAAVRMDIKLQDTTQVLEALSVLESAISRCRAILSYKMLDERAALLTVRMLLREANQKNNKYRRIRPG
jgi:hypothetical protein